MAQFEDMTTDDLALQIESGAWYQTRDGRILGPFKPMPPEYLFDMAWSWTDVDHRDENHKWRSNGRYDLITDRDHDLDLVLKVDPPQRAPLVADPAQKLA